MRTFFVAGIGIAVFIEFLLISKKNKSTPDLILTLCMFLIIVHFFLLYVSVTGDAYSFLFLWDREFSALQGVFCTSHLT
jgi:hypothetical protein